MSPLAIGLLMILATICFVICALVAAGLYAAIHEAKTKGWDK